MCLAMCFLADGAPWLVGSSGDLSARATATELGKGLPALGVDRATTTTTTTIAPIAGPTTTTTTAATTTARAIGNGRRACPLGCHCHSRTVQLESHRLPNVRRLMSRERDSLNALFKRLPFHQPTGGRCCAAAAAATAAGIHCGLHHGPLITARGTRRAYTCMAR
jgi:hypothetical protein